MIQPEWTSGWRLGDAALSPLGGLGGWSELIILVRDVPRGMSFMRYREATGRGRAGLRELVKR